MTSHRLPVLGAALAAASLCSFVVHQAASGDVAVLAQDVCPATPGQGILALVNGERAAHGLPPYAADTLLARAAMIHAEDMARTGIVSHDGSDGSDPSERLDAVGYPWTWVGENVAAGQDDPVSVVAGWMRSEAHRNNVLHDSFTAAGVALVRSPAGRWGTFWVMVYGTARPPSAAVVRCHP